MGTERTVHQTTDYKKFKMLIDNRETSRGHINKLKDAISKNPEIMEVQPILVNEKFEIIDGQHRFTAASEMGLPICYVQIFGLDIAVARQMNVMQRRWVTDDYAHSYAKAGNIHYKAFNKYRREHPSINATIVMTVLGNGEVQNMTHDFRNGEFVIKRDQEDAEYIFEQIESIGNITNNEIPISKPFVSALLKCLENEDFHMEEFIERLKRKPELFHRTVIVRDALRMIEDVYNFSKSTNLLRLY